MSSKPEPMIWSRDTGQQIAYFDSCQLTITWMPKIKDVAMVYYGATLLFLQAIGIQMDVCTHIQTVT